MYICFIYLQQKLQELVPNKEEAKLIATEENFKAGLRTRGYQQFLENCAVLVIAVSIRYINDRYLNMIGEDAFTREVPIFPIFIENITSDRLPLYIKAATRKFQEPKLVQEGIEFKIHPNWDTVCKSIIRQSKKRN